MKTKMNKEKENLFLRAALYEEYGGRCFYDGLPIRFKDMHIDHIIPESFLKKEENRIKISKELGLSEDFKINSLCNLAPCSPNANLYKNKSVYPIHYLEKLILDTSIKMVEKIEKRIQNLRENHNDDEQFTKLLAYLSEYDNKEKLEELYNQLTNEKPFEVSREISRYHENYIFKRSLPNVHLMGYLPQYPDLEGSCLITFSNLRLRDCMITLNHSQIMSTLFEGAKTKLEYQLRSYILHSKELNPEVYYVDLANIRLPLEKREVEQLIEIIDDFYDYYIMEAEKSYQLFRKDIFSTSNEKNRIKLFEINKSLWFLILQFCREWDYSKGNSEWHIFDATGSSIKIYDKIKGEFRMFVHAEIEQADFLISPHDRVWLVWSDEFFWKKKLSDFEQNYLWSPEYSYNWLIKKFIPFVVYTYTDFKSKLFVKKPTFDEFRVDFDITDYAFNLPEIDQEDSLLHAITKLQIFFSTYKNDVYTKQEINDLYDCLIMIIKNSDIGHDGLRYISGNLNIRDVQNKVSLINGINNLKQNLNEENVFSGFFIDLIFRGMVVSIRDYKNGLSDEDEKLIKEKIQPFSKKHIENDIREKA